MLANRRLFASRGPAHAHGKWSATNPWGGDGRKTGHPVGAFSPGFIMRPLPFGILLYHATDSLTITFVAWVYYANDAIRNIVWEDALI